MDIIYHMMSFIYLHDIKMLPYIKPLLKGQDIFLQAVGNASILCLNAHINANMKLSYTHSDHWFIKVSAVYLTSPQFSSVSGGGLLYHLPPHPFSGRCQGLDLGLSDHAKHIYRILES